MLPWLDRLSTVLVYQASPSLTLQKFLQGERWAGLMDFTSPPSSTAPSPVQNLMVGFLSDSAIYNTSTRIYGISVNISWQLPQYPNGEIIAYSYRLVGTTALNITIIPDMNTTRLCVQQCVMVSPFTNYTAIVVASTSAGSGESVMEVALSPEAGNVACRNKK